MGHCHKYASPGYMNENVYNGVKVQKRMCGEKGNMEWSPEVGVPQAKMFV